MAKISHTHSLCPSLSRAFLITLFIAKNVCGEAPYSTVWTRYPELGSPGFDYSYDVSADHMGNVYVSGVVYDGSIGGADVFLSKFNTSGVHQWTRQFGTPSNDTAFGLSSDPQGNVYLTGYTEGNLQGMNAGNKDVYVRKYDPAGNPLRTKQLGTTTNDWAFGISATENGSIYIAGGAGDHFGGPGSMGRPFVAKLNSSSGDLLWTFQDTNANDDDFDGGVATDGLGNVYAVGTASKRNPLYSNLFDYFPMIAKYNSAGQRQWLDYHVTDADTYATDVAADGFGNVYIAGYTSGSFDVPNSGDYDALLMKYTSGGIVEWIRNFGTSSSDSASGVSVDGLGNVLVTGRTGGDPFLRKYDAAGNLLWTRQLGTAYFDYGYDVAADGFENAYIAGTALDFSNHADAWVKRLAAPFVGDFNKDGTVDGADFVVWRKTDGTPAGYNTWRANFGRTLGGSGSAVNATVNSASVPEPATWTLVVLAALLLPLRYAGSRSTVPI